MPDKPTREERDKSRPIQVHAIAVLIQQTTCCDDDDAIKAAYDVWDYAGQPACTGAALSRPAPAEDLQRYIPDIVKNAMLCAWNEICSDTGCHPDDIERNFEGRRGHLGFEPKHWAQMTGENIARTLKRGGYRPAPAAEVPGLETIQTLLDLLNPLHGSLDKQTYDDKMRAEFDTPPDAEYAVNVTAQQERDLTQAVLILEDRKRQATVVAAAEVTGERICEACKRPEILWYNCFRLIEDCPQRAMLAASPTPDEE